MSEPDLARGFAAALDELQSRGMERKRIAQVLDVTPSAMARWSSGERTIPVEKLPIVDALCGQPRGHVLRLAGYVSDSVDVVTVIRTDPQLDHDEQDALLSVYNVFRRDGVSFPPEVVELLSDEELAELRSIDGLDVEKLKTMMESPQGPQLAQKLARQRLAERADEVPAS